MTIQNDDRYGGYMAFIVLKEKNLRVKIWYIPGGIYLGDTNWRS